VHTLAGLAGKPMKELLAVKKLRKNLNIFNSFNNFVGDITILRPLKIVNLRKTTKYFNRAYCSTK
jgi:hypothetical protein